MKKILPPILFFILICSLLEFAVRAHWVSATLIPGPSQILKVFAEESADFLPALMESLFHTTTGWILSVVAGSLIALVFSFSPTLRRAIFPFAIFFQTVPIIAIAPLLVIYFGFGAPAVIMSSLIVSFFPILANTLVGLGSPSREQFELFRLYNASRFQTLWKLQMPSAFTAWFAGLRISVGLAVIGTVAGEFVAGGGLGAVIDAARTQQRIDRVFAAILLLSLMAGVLILLLNIFRVLILRYRTFANGEMHV